MENQGGHLTNESFWDEYWSSVTLPAVLDLEDPGTRSLAHFLEGQLQTYLSPAQGRSLVEIGTAPGRWLEFFNRLGYVVAGIESAPRAAQITRENLEALGIDAPVYEADALELLEKERGLAHSFDCVLSLGLVEHFEEPREILEVHRWLAKPGGLVLIGVPNFRGLSGLLQEKLDPEWLKHHNTEVMTPQALLEAGSASGLLPLHCAYTGGFNPDLYNWRNRSLLGFVITRAGKLLRKIPGADFLQSRHLSSYLVASFRVPED